jgi:hypothetical protein
MGSTATRSIANERDKGWQLASDKALCPVCVQVKTLVLTDDELKHLEKLFGPVRLMGAWITDSTFGYSSVPMLAVQMAVEILDDPDLFLAASRLSGEPEQSKLFIELLESFGPVLINSVVTAYKQHSV